MTPVDDFLRLGLGLDGLDPAKRKEKRGEETNGKERKGKAEGWEKEGKRKSGGREGRVGSADKEGISRLRNSRFRGKVRGEARCRKLPRQGAACHRESSRPEQAASSAAGIYLAFACSYPSFRIPLRFSALLKLSFYGAIT